MIIFFPSVVLACLGFLSPANRGALMTCAVVLWVLLGTPAGYVSARLYKSKCPLCFFVFVSLYFNKVGLFEIFTVVLPARKQNVHKLFIFILERLVGLLTWRKLNNAHTRRIRYAIDDNSELKHFMKVQVKVEILIKIT